MKCYSGEYSVLILTIALFANWTNIVNGAVAEQDTADQGATEREVQEATTQPDITQLLPSVMQGLTDVTNKPLIMLSVPLEDVNERIRSLQASYPDRCSENNYVNGTEFNCKLMNSILTLRTVTEKPQHMYLSVHQGNMPADSTFPTSICPKLPCSTTKHQSLTCKDYFNKCRSEPNTEWCQDCNMGCNDRTTGASVTNDGGTTANNPGSPCDMTGQAIGDNVMPIVIASIVSFFAGAVLCFLVLCLIRYLRERLCLKPIHTTYAAKPEKTHIQATKSKMLTNTTSASNMTEHDYLELRSDTLPYSNNMSKYRPSEDKTSPGGKQPNTTAQIHVYETMTHAQEDHVYSGLGNSEYRGMVNDKHSSDPTIRQ